MKPELSTEDVLKAVKAEFEQAIISGAFNGQTYANGNKAKEALIRSQKLINFLHDLVKSEFIHKGVNPKKIFPPLGASKPEIKLSGFLKSKNQDICIVPVDDLEKIKEQDIEKILTVNVRSQLSSLSKNIDTLYERTFAEALNLHLKYPKQCLGEVYLIPTHEYDDAAMFKNEVKFKSSSKIEDYIKIFQAINNRDKAGGDEFKYERVCLLITDFRSKQPKLYSSIEDLKKDKLVARDTKTTLEKLNFKDFAADMIAKYEKRFDSKNITK